MHLLSSATVTFRSTASSRLRLAVRFLAPVGSMTEPAWVAPAIHQLVRHLVGAAVEDSVPREARVDPPSIPMAPRPAALAVPPPGTPCGSRCAAVVTAGGSAARQGSGGRE